MKIRLLRSDLLEYIKKQRLDKKWEKAKTLFENDIKHPSLNIELLQPKWRGIYSFRIDLKFRALFFFDGEEAEVFQITNHYKK